MHALDRVLRAMRADLQIAGDSISGAIAEYCQQAYKEGYVNGEAAVDIELVKAKQCIGDLTTKVAELEARWCDNGCSGACSAGVECDQYEAMLKRRAERPSASQEGGE